MSKSKIVSSNDIGRPWKSEIKPDNRRKLNLKDKKGKR